MRHRLAAVLLLLPVALVAQHPQVRDGFWIGFGFGYGSAHFTCSGGCDTTFSGATGHLRLGGTLSSHILLGADIVAWSKADSGVTNVMGNTNFEAYYYPNAAGGLFLKGGLGVAVFSNSGRTGGDIKGNGGGITLGLGYDIRVARMFSITPVASLVVGSVGDLKQGNTTIQTGWKQRLLEFGLDATFH